MFKFSLALIVTAAALAGCARSEDADTKVARNDVDRPAVTTDIDAQIDTVAPPANDLPIAQVLRSKLGQSGALGDNTKWLVAHTDLNGDGTDEALAYVMDPMACGTGGCTLFVLGQKDGVWEITDEIGPSRLPVYRLDAGPDGWAVLGVTIGGGGAQPAVMTVDHNAKGYIDNPTVAPAEVVVVSGREPLLPEDEGTPLPQGQVAD